LEQDPDVRAALDAAGVPSGRAGRLSARTWPAGRPCDLGAHPLTRGGRRLSQPKIAAALRRAGRQRGIETAAERIGAALRTPQRQVPPGVVGAYAVSVGSLVAVIDALATQVEALREQAEAGCGRHPTLRST
jgi:hypothetical protein